MTLPFGLHYQTSPGSAANLIKTAGYGNIYYVDSGGGGSTTSGGRTPETAFTTLDSAVGACTANNGDVIFVMPGHAETLAADSAVDLDVAGVTVIGIGNGEDRPIFTFATDTDADFKIAAANVKIHNLVFKCNIASQVMMIEVSADDAEISHCEFREGSATGLNMISVGLADGDSDRFYIHDCKFHAPTAGNYDEAIAVLFDMTGGRIENCEIYGDFDEAGIEIPAGGNAQVDLHIKDCVITNLLTGQHAIQINGTGSTGKIVRVYTETDALATSVDAGGLEMFEVYHHLGTDQAGWTRVAVEPDSTANILGADDSNNDFASTNVTGNADGSVLERLEYIQATGTAVPSADATTNTTERDVVGNKTDAAVYVPGTQNSLAAYAKGTANLQERVAVSATAVMADNDTLFTVAGGPIMIIGLVSECMTANDATASTLVYKCTPTVGSEQTISGASASLANAAAGATITLAGTALSTAALYNANGPNLIANPGTVVAPAGTIDIDIAVGSTTGTWRHLIRYKPLAVGVTVS